MGAPRAAAWTIGVIGQAWAWLSRLLVWAWSWKLLIEGRPERARGRAWRRRRES